MNSIATLSGCALAPWEHALDNGCVIRGQRTLPSGKPVLHFLHGNGFCGLSYWPFLSQLTESFDLFVHDIQGHGDSDGGDRFWGWNENARVVYDVWQHFQADYKAVSTFAMGHSLGGILTVLMAADQPSAFQGLVLLDPVIFTPTMLVGMNVFKFLHLRSPNPLVKKALYRRNQWSSLNEVKQDFAGKGIFKGWHDDALTSHINYALYEQGAENIRLKCSPRREAEIFASFPRQLWPSLKKITLPTVILYGANTYAFVKKSVKIVQGWEAPHLSSITMPGGHCFMQENPLAAAKAVREASQKSVSGINKP